MAKLPRTINEIAAQRAASRETRAAIRAMAPTVIELDAEDRRDVARKCGVNLRPDPEDSSGLAYHYREGITDQTGGRLPLLSTTGPCLIDLLRAGNRASRQGAAA